MGCIEREKLSFLTGSLSESFLFVIVCYRRTNQDICWKPIRTETKSKLVYDLLGLTVQQRDCLLISSLHLRRYALSCLFDSILFSHMHGCTHNHLNTNTWYFVSQCCFTLVEFFCAPLFENAQRYHIERPKEKPVVYFKLITLFQFFVYSLENCFRPELHQNYSVLMTLVLLADAVFLWNNINF